MKRKILLRESELIDLIEKIIYLNEADNVAPSAVPPSPPSPPNRRLTAVDFVGNATKVVKLPPNLSILKNKFLFFQPQGQDYVTLEKTNPTEFCNAVGSVTTTGLKSILMPRVNASDNVEVVPDYPPVKYVCEKSGTDTYLRLVSIDQRDALEIKKKTGFDYNQASTKHLIRKTPGVS